MIGDANYYGLGALSLSAIYSMSCEFFNPSMLEQTNPGTDLYQLVLDGKWTWDKMTELASNANDDLDGNSVMDVSDRFGMVIMNNGNPVNQYMVGTGEMLSTRKRGGIVNYKGALQQIVQNSKGDKLEYIQVNAFGPDHDKTFVVRVMLNSNTIGEGQGRSKQEAEQAAAREALALFGENV